MTKVSTGARAARRHRWTPEQISVKQFVRPYKTEGGMFRRWGHVVSIGVKGTSRVSYQNLARPMITGHHLVLPWFFDELKFDVEYIRALSAMTNNFEHFPGQWSRFDAVSSTYLDLCGIVLPTLDRYRADQWLKRRWLNAEQDMKAFKNSLEPFRIRSDRATNAHRDMGGDVLHTNGD